MKLSEAKIKAAKPRDREYKLADGHGLTLLVMPHGSKLWRFRVYQGGKENMLSLGAYPVVTLAAARDRALDLRRARVAAIAFQPFGDRYDLHALSTYPPAAVPAAKPASAERFRWWMLLPGGGLVAFWRLWRRIS
jgi:hypothetical protein